MARSTRKALRKSALRPFGSTRNVGEMESLVTNYYASLDALGGEGTYSPGKQLYKASGPNVYRFTFDAELGTSSMLLGIRSLDTKIEFEYSSQLQLAFNLLRALCAKYHPKDPEVIFDTDPYAPKSGRIDEKKTFVPVDARGSLAKDYLPLLAEKVVAQGEQFGYIAVPSRTDIKVNDLVLHTSSSAYVLRHTLRGDNVQDLVAYAKLIDDVRLGRKIRL